MRTVTVQVTAADIRNGRPVNPCGCPLALALQRATRCSDWRVGGAFCYLAYFPSVRVPLSRRAARFVAAVDSYGRAPVKPATFYLRIPT